MFYSVDFASDPSKSTAAKSSSPIITQIETPHPVSFQTTGKLPPQNRNNRISNYNQQQSQKTNTTRKLQNQTENYLKEIDEKRPTSPNR